MVHIGNLIGEAHHPAFQRFRILPGSMAGNTIQNIGGQIESLAVVFQKTHHPHALFCMTKTMRTTFVERILPRVSVRGMSQIMSQSNRLCKILVKAQRTCNSACNL
ncbi:hypothetical protein SDC9_175467 [bioreactor metagenome]|uniref:Uncharacterized protein n=1 Tax=bioreactor metagenome TaxID=1076179 RepID=A0A645GP92_9ZZZZ